MSEFLLSHRYLAGFGETRKETMPFPVVDPYSFNPEAVIARMLMFNGILSNAGAVQKDRDILDKAVAEYLNKMAGTERTS